MASNVSEALRWAIGRLGAHGSPRAEAEELLGRLLGLRRADLYLEPDFEVAPHEWERFEQWVARRAAGEPLQYITGRAAFRDLDLAVDPRVLVPRPETEGLVEAVLEALRADSARWPAPRVLDLGTGSGAVALSLAHEFPQARVTATDASAGALEVARDNARRLGLEGRVTFLAGAWFDAVGDDDRFEVVVSNPPYVAAHEWPALPADVRQEPHGALVGGESGLDDVRVIVADAPRHLVAGGVLALELAEQRTAEVAAWFEGAHDWREAQLLNDLAGRPRVLIARRADGPAIAPAQWGEDAPGGA